MDSEIKRKVLLVDDESELLLTIQEALELKGLNVLVAESVAAGLEVIEKNSQDLSFIVCDYRISETETGFDLRKQMNDAGHKEIPFAILSGYLTKELALDGIEHAICAFLEKPMQPTSLFEVILAKSQERFEDVLEEIEMVVEFKGDALTMLDEIEANILSLETNPHDSATVDNAMRLLHTIKGTSGCLGLSDVQQFAHAYEDFLGPVKRGEWPATRSVVDQALKAFDELKTMVNHMGDFGYTVDNMEELKKLFDITIDKILVEAEALAPAEDSEKQVDTGQADQQAGAQGQEKVDEIAVATELLDEFMEQSGELTVLRSMVVKHVRSLEQTYGQTSTLERLVEALDEMHSVSSNMQNKIVDIRKIPLRNLLRTLPRVVRDASAATKKQVNFTVKGESLRVDTSIGQVLTNSLVHMVRNSVDHGLEATAEDRVANGKEPAGNVSINCFERGEDIIVEIQDDGRGISVDAVKAKCLENELRTEEELLEMSDNQIRAMIFEAGFSTAAQVTSVSGRGVGMDMVKSSVYEAGGQVLIDSEIGKGTKFTLVLPIPKSVLIIRALFVCSSNNTLALNQDEIHKVIYVEPDKKLKTLRNMNDRYFLPFEGGLIPIVRLSSLLGIDGEADNFEIAGEDGISRLVVMRAGKGFFCIAVDQVMDNEEIVVKELADCLKGIGVYAGATFLGDGQTALVLDSEGLARHAGVKVEAGQARRAADANLDDDEQAQSGGGLELLVVKSVSGEEVALRLEDVHRLEDVTVSKIEKVGSQPVVQYAGQPMPLFELVNRSPVQVSEYDSDKALNIVVVSFDDQLVGYQVQEIVDVFEVFTEIDTRVTSGNLVGTYFVGERTVPLVKIFEDTEEEASNVESLSHASESDSDTNTKTDTEKKVA